MVVDDTNTFLTRLMCNSGRSLENHVQHTTFVLSVLIALVLIVTWGRGQNMVQSLPGNRFRADELL